MDNFKEIEEKESEETSSKPKYTQFIKMLTFRVVPAYYREIEKVAKLKKSSVSKLIRTYIKEGMIRDKEISNQSVDFETEPTS